MAFEIPPLPFDVDRLPYERPELGRSYWVLENALVDAATVVERCWARSDWSLGAPFRNESWPGMRAPGALTAAELRPLEEWVMRQVGATRLFQSSAGADPGGQLSHNHVQVVGGAESIARPHVDALRYCDYAGVLFLHPYPPTKHAGTSFFRLRSHDGRLGGNYCPPPFFNLTDALGVRSLPITAWEEDVEVHNVFNRLLVYRASFVHSATSYFGMHLKQKRMTAVFFWKAER